nr:transposase family protein [Gammaproteobacteria bacterium]
GLSLSIAEGRYHAAQASLGRRSDLCADGAGLCIWWPLSTGTVAACWPGEYLTIWNRHACVEALAQAIDRYGVPDIFNTDQGVQFTSEAFTGSLQQHGIQISMDGNGCYRDNIFVERLWRSVKCECLYIQAFADGRALRQGLKQYFDWYNDERPHQGLDYQTPDEVYRGSPHWRQAA